MATYEQEPRLTGKLKRAFNEREANQIWRALEARRAPARVTRGPSRPWPAALACTLVAGLLLLTWRQEQDAPLALQDARALPLELVSPRSSATFRLDDGSQIALAHGAALEVVRNDGRELMTVLRKGKVTFDVKPGGKRHWSIEAGLLSVQVLGTQFVVERHEQSVSVQVRRGVVLVRAAHLPDGVRRLTAGQSVVVSREPGLPTKAPTATPTETPATTTATNTQVLPDTAAGELPWSRSPKREEVTPPSEPSVAGRTVPDAGARGAAVGATLAWWVLAERGAYVAARQRIEAQGGMRAVVEQTREPQRLLSLADVARKVGEPQAATAPLEQLLRGAPQSAEASVAAFILGKLELDELARPEAAIAHFTLVVTRAATVALAEDALARLVDAHARSGQADRARARAAEYLARYPQGRHLERMERMQQEAEPLP